MIVLWCLWLLAIWLLVTAAWSTLNMGPASEEGLISAVRWLLGIAMFLFSGAYTLIYKFLM